jgi:hypothetical protein
MSTAIASVINELAQRAGVAPDNESLKALLSSAELSKITLSDDIEHALSSRLMNLEEAKTSVEVKKHFSATTLKAVDKNIIEALEEAGIDGDDRAAIEAEQNTYKRVKMLADAVRSLESKKVTAAGGDKKALADQIAALNAEIVKQKEAATQAVGSERSRWESEVRDMAINTTLSSYQWGNGVPDDINRQTVKIMLDNKLKELGGVAVYRDGKIELISKDHPDLPLTVNNKPANIKDIADAIAAPLIKKSPTQPPAPLTPAQPPAPAPASSARAISHLDEQIKQFQ